MREPIRVPTATDRVVFDRQETPRAAVLRPSGEVDFTNAHALLTNLKAILEDRQNVVLDLSNLSYMDSGGVKVLLDAHRLFLQKKQGFALANPSRIVSMILEVVGLDKHFPVFDSVEAALGSFACP
jgi:stage II sporulation protein AA (anti-sigma F factor antagonist)